MPQRFASGVEETASRVFAVAWQGSAMWETERLYEGFQNSTETAGMQTADQFTLLVVSLTSC